MTLDELKILHILLEKFIKMKSIMPAEELEHYIETRRKVELDIQLIDPNWRPE